MLLFVTSDENWLSGWEPCFRKLWRLFKSSFLLYYPRKKTLDMWPCLSSSVWFLWMSRIQIQAPGRKHSSFLGLTKVFPWSTPSSFYCLVTLSSEAVASFMMTTSPRACVSVCVWGKMRACVCLHECVCLLEERKFKGAVNTVIQCAWVCVRDAEWFSRGTDGEGWKSCHQVGSNEGTSHIQAQ